MSKPLEFTAFPKSLLCSYGPYAAVVEYVKDGDTLSCLADVGLRVYPFVSIRIRGINAPELSTGTVEQRIQGVAARDFLAAMLPAGTPVKLTTERDVMTFDRFVADITLADGRDVGAAMIAAGHAVAMPR